MDKLEHIFELQKGFQDKIKRERNLDFTPDQWIQKQTLAMISELAELLDEVNFKWWKNPHELNNANIREELGMAYSVYTYPSSYRGVGTFNIYAGTNPENGETVIREIKEQLRLFLEKGMTEKEFKSAKAQLRGGFLLGLESSSGRMQALGRGMLLFGHVKTPEETIEKIDAVTMESVMELAKRLLNAKPSAAIVGKDAQKYLDFIGG